MNPIQMNVLARLYAGELRLDSMDKREREKTERILRHLRTMGLTLERGGRWCASIRGAELVKAARVEGLA